MGEGIRLFATGASRAEVDHIWRHDIVPSLGPSLRFLFAKRTEIFGRQFLRAARTGKSLTDFWTFGQRAMRYSNFAVIDKVSAPVLVNNYQLEQFYPGQAQRLYDALRSPKKLVTFTVAEGAEYHDAPMAPQRRNQVIFDWLDDTLGVN